MNIGGFQLLQNCREIRQAMDEDQRCPAPYCLLPCENGKHDGPHKMRLTS